MALNPRRLAIERLVLRSPDPAALAAFYRDALGFVEVDRDDDTVRLTLGDTRLDIETASGAGYPGDVPGWSPLFQHFAIRVADMTTAYARLRSMHGWRPISAAGPERLPANTGGVTAFKFRDPDGHPLELLAFPGRPHVDGIDHTAVSVADVARSVAFYTGLGFTVAGRTTNRGVEQERLDGVDDAVVDIVSLVPSLPSAIHLELLGYRGAHDRESVSAPRRGDVAAMTIVVTPETALGGEALHDPDGHRLEVAGSSRQRDRPPRS